MQHSKFLVALQKNTANEKEQMMVNDLLEIFAWITKDNIDYLLFPEFLAGYSIFNTQTNELHSFYTENEPFIWQKIEFDPINNQLIVEGNYGACPTGIITYDCSKITQLPYLFLKRCYPKNH